MPSLVTTSALFFRFADEASLTVLTVWLLLGHFDPGSDVCTQGPSHTF